MALSRRGFLGGALWLISLPATAGAQGVSGLPRLGWLSDGVRAGSRSSLHDAFLQALRALGYVEGQSIMVERRDANQQMEHLDALAEELVRRNVDVIVATSGAAALAARRVTKSTPIVMAESGDPVAIGLVASLGRPGGNVTGLSLMDQELTAKRLHILKEVAPKTSRIAVLVHPPFPATLMAVDEARMVAGQLGLTVLPMEVGTSDALEAAFADVVRRGADALVTSGDPFSSRHQGRIIALAAKHRLPAASLLREFAEAGGLLAYGPSLSAVYRQAAVYVDKILKGAKAGDLPIEQPTRFDLVLNVKTARTLALKIPPSLLLRADHIIE